MIPSFVDVANSVVSILVRDKSFINNSHLASHRVKQTKLAVAAPDSGKVYVTHTSKVVADSSFSRVEAEDYTSTSASKMVLSTGTEFKLIVNIDPDSMIAAKQDSEVPTPTVFQSTTTWS